MFDRSKCNNVTNFFQNFTKKIFAPLAKIDKREPKTPFLGVKTRFLTKKRKRLHGDEKPAETAKRGGAETIGRPRLAVMQEMWGYTFFSDTFRRFF